MVNPQTDGAIDLRELNLVLPLEDIYQGLSFPNPQNDGSLS